MRPALIVLALLSTLFAACASDQPTARQAPQTGPLKVHPDLLGKQPLPAQDKAPAAGPVSAEEGKADAAKAEAAKP